MRRKCVRLLLLFSFAFWFGGAAYSQFRTAIQGIVTDVNGAVVPNATVTLLNKETGRAQQTITNETGFYRISGLAPGSYTISAEAAGFKKQVIENLVIGAEELRGVNLTLEPGQVTETVTVSAESNLLHTEGGEVAGTITTTEILRLPQIGRDPYELVRLAPGVFGLGARTGTGAAVNLPNTVGPGGSNDQIFATENRPPITANGQRVEANNIQIDGVTAMSQAWGGAAVVTPNQESVKEVRVLANNYSAEYGRNTGAQVLVVSQTGTNDLHGSFFFKRNTPGMNAKQDFTRAGTAIREDPQRVEQFLSQWGGSVGGPIYLPRFGEGGPAYWSGKNKLFFFISYERVGRSSSRLAGEWIETPNYVEAVKRLRPNSVAAKILNFPGMTPPRVASIDSSRNCASAGFIEGVNCRTVAGGLDIGSINQAARPGVPQPDTGGGLDGVPDIQFAQLFIPDKTTAQQFNARIDFQVTKDDLVAFSMYWVPNTRNFNDPWNKGRPALDFTSARRNMVGTLLWTRTLSPTMINEARFNVTRWYFDEVKSNPNIGWGIPRANVCFNPGCIGFGTGIGPGVFYQTTYNARDTLSKVVGAHALKFGVDLIAEQNNDHAPWAGRPTFDFGNLWSFANDAPNDESAFFDPKTGGFTDLAAYARSKYYALFVQDDWKPRPNLTLNLGLRWEYFTPLRSANDHISNLILGPNGSLLGARLKVGGDLFRPDRNNFGPQLGFAWNPAAFERKMVLRGGFGIGYNRLPGSRLLESRFNPPFFAGFFFDQASGNIFYATASDLNSFNYPANRAATLTFDPNTGIPLSGPPVNVNATLQDVPNPYAYRYSLTWEYELGANWLASVAYQGSAAHKLPRLVPYHKFVTPNPRIGSVNLMLTDVNSNFNALLVGATHRFARGFLFNAEYRWSKSLDTCSNDHDCRQTYPFDQRTEYGPSDFDVRHALKAYGVWELPLLRGRSDWLGKLVGGWEVSGILTASSGFPWTPVVGGGQCNAQVAGGNVCPLRPVAQVRPPATTDTGNDTFLGAGPFPGGGLLYFVPPPAGTFAVPPRPGVGRNSLRGPRYFSVDMTLLKRFGLPAMPVLGEKSGIELRANFYNLFNTVNLAPFQANDDNTQIQHPDFGRALHVLAGRVVEIQARFSF
ncbi:TonB-dependent receptor [Pyrinomonas methylaliphatogenes]|uniref:Outer membrane receptor protein n=1 Tax=Pyrinomonas methylaliphatogenes TaxID=454194 RepID=A0A0B6WVI4_9BACT|nr:TonB-dependent receptor [Pyrinomonas methylaliphatogenes]MBX5477843.1 TonB-dependent receptor [Pyrinomonas methylaliphatogenes]CDM64120.1 outer membrane receptor protein [Pyrinomonas methylaliphatogenes]